MKEKKDIENQLKQLALEYSVYYGDIIEIVINVKRDRRSANLDIRIKNV